KSFERRPYDVHLGLLGRQRDAGRLRMKAQQQRPLVARTEPVAELTRPDPSRRAIFRDLLEEVHVGVEEEREPRSEIVDVEAALARPLDVREPVGERECELLRG